MQQTIPVNDGIIESHVGTTPSSGPFAVDFPFFSLDDVIVTSLADGIDPDPATVLVRGADYTLVGAATEDGSFSSGTVTLVLPVANTTISRYRSTEIERLSNFPLQGFFSRLALNAEFNKITMILQEIEAGFGRVNLDSTLHIPLSEADDGVVTVAAVKAERAGKVLAWDGAGNLIHSTLGLVDLETGVGLNGSEVATVGTLAALKALTPGSATVFTKCYAAIGDGGGGAWMFDVANLGAEVAGDPQSGLFAAPDSDPTGASGAWRRQYSGAISVRWFGAGGNGATDDSPAIQGAITAAAGQLVLAPLGRYRLDSKITSVLPVNLVGEGSGGGPGAVLNTNCTQFVAFFGNDNVFEVTSQYASTFKNLQITSDPSVRPCTAGAGIRLIGTGTGTVSSYLIEEVATAALFQGVSVLRPALGTITHTYHQVWEDAAIHMETSTGVEGSAGWITENYMFASTTSVACIRLKCGYVACERNWCVGAGTGIIVQAADNPMGSPRIIGNIIENQRSSGINVSTVANTAMAMLVIDNNEFSATVGTGSYGASILINDNGGTPYLDSFSVCGNITRHVCTVATTKHIWVGSGKNGRVSFNILNELGSASPDGLRIWGSASNAGFSGTIACEDNAMLGTFGVPYLLVPQVRLRAMDGMTIATLPPCANGSEAYVTNGAKGTAPISAGTGALALRQNGQWNGV